MELRPSQLVFNQDACNLAVAYVYIVGPFDFRPYVETGTLEESVDSVCHGQGYQHRQFELPCCRQGFGPE